MSLINFRDSFINLLVLFRFINFIINFSILLICVIISSDVIGRTISKKPQDFSQVAKCPFATLTNLGVFLFLNLWAILNQYLLQNKHASRCLNFFFSTAARKKVKANKYDHIIFRPPPPLFFQMFGCCLSMSICVFVDPFQIIVNHRGFFLTLPRVFIVYTMDCSMRYAAQNLRRTWLFWCNSVFCLRRCWGL